MKDEAILTFKIIRHGTVVEDHRVHVLRRQDRRARRMRSDEPSRQMKLAAAITEPCAHDQFGAKFIWRSDNATTDYLGRYLSADQRDVAAWTGNGRRTVASPR